MDEFMEKIVALAKSGKGDEAKRTYVDYMTDYYKWDEDSQLFRRKDAPFQMTYSKEEFNDLLGHNFDRWLGSQQKKTTTNQRKEQSSSILVLENNKLVDPRQSSLRSQINETDTISKSQQKTSNVKKSQQKQHTTTPVQIHDEEPEDENRSVIVSTNSKRTVSNVKQSQSKSAVASLSDQSIQQQFENLTQNQSHVAQSTTSNRKNNFVADEPINNQSLVVSQQKVQSAIKQQQSHQKQENPSDTSFTVNNQSAIKQSQNKQTELVDQSVNASNGKQIAVSSAIKHSRVKDESLNLNNNAQSAIKQSQQKKDENVVDDIKHSQQKIQPPFEQIIQKPQSVVKQQNDDATQQNNFEPVSFVKNAIHPPPSFNISASSRKTSKAARPDDRSILAFRSLLCQAMGVDPDMFEELKKDHSDYLFTDPLTSNEFLLLRYKKTDNSVVRVFATGEGLTMQQTKFGLRNLYEKRYPMRSFERDVDTLYQVRDKTISLQKPLDQIA